MYVNVTVIVSSGIKQVVTWHFQHRFWNGIIHGIIHFQRIKWNNLIETCLLYFILFTQTNLYNQVLSFENVLKLPIKYYILVFWLDYTGLKIELDLKKKSILTIIYSNYSKNKLFLKSHFPQISFFLCIYVWNHACSGII
jgi:hypothetical protein